MTSHRPLPPGGFPAWIAALLLLALLLQGCGGNAQVRESTLSSGDPSDAPSASTTASNDGTLAETTAQAGTDAEAGTSGTSSPFDDDPFEDEEEQPETSDPLETVNRGTFWLNDSLYTWFFKPTVKVYRFFVHEKVREGISNVILNFTEPVNVANSLLQLKFENAGRETIRFAVNTTIGVGGIVDVARDYGDLPRKSEDMGQTLGVWGAGHGFYLVLPVLGPSSLRDGIGTVTDYAFTPSTYMDLTLAETASIKGVDYINEFSLDKDTYEAVVKQSLDPYITIRNGYLQRRNSQVTK